MPTPKETKEQLTGTPLLDKLGEAFGSELFSLLEDAQQIPPEDLLDYLGYELEQKVKSQKKVEFKDIEDYIKGYPGASQIIKDLIDIGFEKSPFEDYANKLNHIYNKKNTENGPILSIKGHYKNYIQGDRDTSQVESNKQLHENKQATIDYIAMLERDYPILRKKIDNLSDDFIRECSNYSANNSQISLQLTSMYNLLLIITKGCNTNTVGLFKN